MTVNNRRRGKNRGGEGAMVGIRGGRKRGRTVENRKWTSRTRRRFQGSCWKRWRKGDRKEEDGDEKDNEVGGGWMTGRGYN